MDEIWKYYAMWSIADTKGQLFFKFYLYKFARTGKFIETESKMEVTMGLGQKKMGHYA